MTTHDRPINATLHVHLDNGETWEAKPEDYQRFGLVERGEAYHLFDKTLRKVLADNGLIDSQRGEVTDAQLNPIRYLVETVIVFPDLIDHPEHEGWQSVAELERRLVVEAEQTAHP